jgi:hypothetical protein
MLALPAPAVISGCDLSAHLIAREIDRDEPVALLGLGPQGVASLKARTGLRRVDHHNPPAGFDNDPAAFEKALRFIETHPARFTFLAMGAPQQCLLADALRHAGVGRHERHAQLRHPVDASDVLRLHAVDRRGRQRGGHPSLC